MSLLGQFRILRPSLAAKKAGVAASVSLMEGVQGERDGNGYWVSPSTS